MNKILFGSILTLLFFNVNCQVKISNDFTYTVSKPYEVVDGMKAYFSKDGVVLTLKYGRGKFTFQKFSEESMNETQRNVVEKQEGFTPEDFIEFNDRFYFIFSRWDKANYNEQLFAREISFDDCNFAGPEKLLIKVKGKVTGGVSFDIRSTYLFHSGGGKFLIDQSFGEERLVVQYRVKPEERRDALNKDVFGMTVFDENMSEVWGKEVEMPYTEKKMNNIDFTIDAFGNAYVLAEVYKDETTRRKTKDGDPNYRLEVIKISTEDQAVSVSEVELKGRFITDVGFYEGKENQIVVAGYYGNKNNGGTDGVFYSKLDQSGNVVDQTSAEIPVNVMSLYMSERAQERMEKKDDRGSDLSIPNMVLRQIFFEDDGSVTLYGERYFWVKTQNTQTKTWVYTSYYQEILAAKLNADGSVAWMNKFPKNQQGTSNVGPRQEGMGYYLMTMGDYTYTLFLDNVKNIELAMDKYPKTHIDGRGGFLTGFKINNETGETEKISLFDTRDAKGVELFQFETGRIIEVEENSFALECYKKGKEDVMIYVKLND